MNVSFCSLASQSDFLAGLNSLPSFDKINTFWQSEPKKPAQRVSISSVSDVKSALSIPEVKPAKSSASSVASSFGMSKSKKEKRALPEDFEPSEYSVICGRTQKCYNSTGNRRFRVLVKMRLNEYMQAEGKPEKSEVVSAVLDSIQEACPVGSFVTYENGRWYEVSERMKREKIGGLFRDLLHTKYKSSAKAKQAKKVAKERLMEAKFQPQQQQSQHFGGNAAMMSFAQPQNQLSPSMMAFSQTANRPRAMQLPYANNVGNEASSMLPQPETPSMMQFGNNNASAQYMGQQEPVYNFQRSGQGNSLFDLIPL